MSSGKRQSRFCPCLCVSQCVCVCLKCFLRVFNFHKVFTRGKGHAKGRDTPVQTPDTIRYIYIYDIKLCTICFSLLFFFFLCAGETLRGDANCFRRLIKIFQASYKLKTRLQLQHGLLPQMLLLLFMQRCTNSAKCKLTFYVVATPATKSRQISNSSSPVEAGK